MNKLHMSGAPRRTVLALAIGLGFSGMAFGQATTGTIFGSAPVATGETVVVSGANGINRSATVDSSGRYTVSGLPVGSYTVTLQKDGQTIATRDKVSINVGGGTEVPFSSEAGAANAKDLGALTVTANALPAIDVSSVNSSTIITAADLQRLPVGRNAESIALLSPGTVPGSGYFGNAVSFGGAGVTENAYYVNGYNTGEPYRNTGGFQLPYGAIDQQQTYTGGYSAQYGRSDGGVISQTGKRGSNEWHFGAQVAWAPAFAAEGGKNVYYPNPTIPAGYEIDDSSLPGTMSRYRNENKGWSTIYSAYAGGPLIKDRLYMFIAAEQTQNDRRNVQSVGGHDYDISDKTRHFYGKLDWNINDSNIVEFTALKSSENTGRGSNYLFDYDTLTRGDFSAANNTAKDSAEFYIGKYTSYITDDATLAITYGQGDFANPTVYGNQSLNPFISGSASQNPGVPPFSTHIINDQTTNSAFSPDATNHTSALRVDFDYKLGSHLLSVGIDNTKASAHLQGQGMSGPGYAWIYSHQVSETSPIKSSLGVGGPGAGSNGYYVAKYIFDVTTSMRTEQKAYYLQDVWSVTDTLQLNLGLRNDHFINYNDLGVAFADQKNQWEPRLGASWDVNGDSSLKVYGNAGRYYLALPNNAAERAANRSTFTREYFTYSAIDPNGIPLNLVPVGGLNGAPPPGPVSANFETGTPKDARQVVATDLKAQYQDEYILGFDKTLGPDWVYGAKLTFRNLKTAIDDECDGGRLATKLTSMGLDPANYSGSLVNPGCRLFNPTLDNTFDMLKDDGTGYTSVHMTGADWGYAGVKAQRKYKALDLYLEHPFNGKWDARVDYTFARNRGNTEGQVRSDIGQGDVSKTEDWDAAQLMEGAYGDLSNSRRHSIRVRGSYQIAPEWMVSGTLLAQSGTPKECLGYYGATPLDGDTNDPIAYGANYHWCGGKLANPGTTGFTPWTKKINLALRYAPAFAGNKLAFQIQVYNVLNEQKAVQIDPLMMAGTGIISNTYNQGIYFETPRYVRLTASYDF